MFRLKSDSPFAEFLRSGGGGMRLALLLLVGAALIFIGSLGGKGSDIVELGEEERVAQICSLMEGVGECEVMITYDPDSREERVFAVLVLCEGADSPTVREILCSSLSSVYGIGYNRIEIQKLNR